MSSLVRFFRLHAPVWGFCFLCLISLVACGAGRQQNATDGAYRSQAVTAPVPSAPVAQPLPAVSGLNATAASERIALCWAPLLTRLRTDNLGGPETELLFTGLPEFSPDPMGTKIAELFKRAFMRPPPAKDDEGKAPKPRIYASVYTEANAQKCLAFLAAWPQAFEGVEKRHGVPKEVIVSLLFVETRLGEFMGKDNALWSLACMAAATAPEQVGPALQALPVTEEHTAWLQEKLTNKSAWAYKELKALLVYCRTQKADPREMPGSVYGAIGICQFMPSNITPYGDDGDGDGVVNLFSVPDAVYSTGRYLAAHGWKPGLTKAQEHAILKRYNNLNIYANTIQALAEAVEAGGIAALEKAKAEAAAAAGGKAKAKKQKTSAKGKPATVQSATVNPAGEKPLPRAKSPAARPKPSAVKPKPPTGAAATRP